MKVQSPLCLVVFNTQEDREFTEIFECRSFKRGKRRLQSQGKSIPFFYVKGSGGFFCKKQKAKMTSSVVDVTLSLSKGLRVVTVICALNPLYGSTELTMTLLLVHKNNEWALNKLYVIGSGGFFQTQKGEMT